MLRADAAGHARPRLPALRLLIVSGESCPGELVRRWATGGRRMLNVYGPTEATVSATWAELSPEQPVTIGVPLPTYRTAVLDADGEPVTAGHEGALVIAGPGLSAGYLGRQDLTDRAFVPAPAALRVALGDRVYRTGDLVRVDESGRIVYVGRIDTQVKLRGYRIELDEIESAILAVPGVAGAAATTVRLDARGPLELAAFFTADRGGSVPTAEAVAAHLRSSLPAYMVPAYLEPLDRLPRLPSDKVDKKALPVPRRRSAAADGPADDREAVISGALAAVLGVPDVGVTAHLFDDLGADSFLVAQYCAALRSGPLPGATTRLVYANPTVRALAAAAPAEPARARSSAAHHATRVAYLATGAAQLAVLALALLGIAALGCVADAVLDAAHGWTVYPAAVGVTVGASAVLAGVPIVLKWVLIGRAQPAVIPAWSAAYLRFWIVRTALRFSPIRLLVGSPLYPMYLRALGARIGRSTLVVTTHVPACPDLVEIGDDAVLAPDVRFDAYRMEGGRVVTGRVRIGDGASVGHGSHLDIDTTIGAGGRLAHASALLAGQEVPPGRAWHGSPAVDDRAAEDAAPGLRVGRAARARYATAQLLVLFLITGPLLIGVDALAPDADVIDPLHAILFAAVLLAASWAIRSGVPRALAGLLRPERDYPVYTAHWALLRASVAAANSPLFNELFGDSSAVVFYLRSVGVRFRRVLQTGSNFGTAQHFDLPSWCSIGGGTLISDGLSMTNAEFFPHSFRVRSSSIGDGVFMGNGVVYPPGAAVGDDCLLATKVMVPLDGPVRSGVGLLGSPAFEVPRTVRRDAAFSGERRGERLRAGLRRKNRHNTVTALLFLAHRFLLGYLAVLLLEPADGTDVWSLFAALVGIAVAEIVLLVVTDAVCRGFRRLTPLTCALYDPRFWRHERYWKLSDPKALAVFDGTPVKPVLWRLLGVRVGRMLLDDGATMPERSMVGLGDHVTLGAGSTLHGHSLEDGVFKSGPIAIGADASVGPSALVHYGVDVGAGARIAPDAFVMKGERIGDAEVWAGNPAYPTA